jgi:HlyD family secretion protein
VGGERRHDLAAQHGRREREPPRDPREGPGSDRRHVLGPRAQRRQLDPRHRQPEVEVGAEAPGPHLPHEVARGGRHHARPHGDRRGPAHPLEAAVLEDVQERGLERPLELAHLVEEERPAGGALEAPDPARERAREGAPLVAEQLALEERPRERRAVGVDERAPPARPRVQRPRRHALPDPGLARQQHGRVEWREPLEVAADRAQARAVAGEATQRVVDQVCHCVDTPVDPDRAGALEPPTADETSSDTERRRRERAAQRRGCADRVGARRSGNDNRRRIRDTVRVAALRRSRRSHPPTIASHRRGSVCSALTALAVTLAAGCGGDQADESVATAVAERDRIERIVVATGTIEPVREVEVRPRIPGIIEKILVAEGDAVEPGQPLVEIERDLLASQAREAEAAVRETEVELRYAKIEVDRAATLEKSGAASPQQGDAARARHERAGASLARAQAARDTLATQLSYATVESPLAGRVLDVIAEEGQAVSPVTAVTGGTLMLSLAATSTLHLEGLVDENEVSRVAVGQPARIRTEAYADRVFQGRVREIAPLGQRVQNVTYFEVEIEVTDPDAALLRPRMSGDGEIVTEVVEGALVIPETALRYRGDEIYVERTNGDGPAEEQAVRVGIVDGSKVQILDGLEAGDRVRLQ